MNGRWGWQPRCASVFYAILNMVKCMPSCKVPVDNSIQSRSMVRRRPRRRRPHFIHRTTIAPLETASTASTTRKSCLQAFVAIQEGLLSTRLVFSALQTLEPTLEVHPTPNNPLSLAHASTFLHLPPFVKLFPEHCFLVALLSIRSHSPAIQPSSPPGILADLNYTPS